MKKFFIPICFIFLALAAEARTIQQTIYINEGNFVAVDGISFPMASFNSSSLFAERPLVIESLIGDTLLLQVINNTTAEHSFQAQGFSLNNTPIAPNGGSRAYSLVTNAAGCFLFYDGLQFPHYRYFGLGGMLTVAANQNALRYFWNLHEFEPSRSQAVAVGNFGIMGAFRPLYFTINNKSFTETNLDATATPYAAVGDTVLVYIANTGLMGHSIHFHGFHFEVVYDSEHLTQRPSRVGWRKDTIWIAAGETLVLRFVPDKTGHYPVHDHNLMSVTGNGMYPNGMMLDIHIHQ